MLYLINDKFYIKVGGYYKEVNIKVDGDTISDVTANGNKIEVENTKNVYEYNIDSNKDAIISKLKNKHQNNKESFNELRSSERNTRRR